MSGSIALTEQMRAHGLAPATGSQGPSGGGEPTPEQRAEAVAVLARLLRAERKCSRCGSTQLRYGPPDGERLECVDCGYSTETTIVSPLARRVLVRIALVLGAVALFWMVPFAPRLVGLVLIVAWLTFRRRRE